MTHEERARAWLGNAGFDVVILNETSRLPNAVSYERMKDSLAAEFAACYEQGVRDGEAKAAHASQGPTTSMTDSELTREQVKEWRTHPRWTGQDARIVPLCRALLEAWDERDRARAAYEHKCEDLGLHLTESQERVEIVAERAREAGARAMQEAFEHACADRGYEFPDWIRNLDPAAIARGEKP